jgi:hypothetical protein
VIEVNARIWGKSHVTTLGLAGQVLGMEILRDDNGTGISHGQRAFISTILRRFNMQNAQDVSTPMDPNVKLVLAEDRGEKEQNAINRYHAIVGPLMYAAHATWHDISFAVAGLCLFNSHRFTSHLIAAKRVLLHLESTANLQMHLRSNTSINDQLTG